MRRQYGWTVTLACLLMTFGALAAAPRSTELMTDSVYAIPALQLRDQTGHAFAFASLRGQPRLVGMFYGSCRMACPLEVEYLKSLQHAVAAQSNQPIPVTLVSFDPTRDDVAMLQKVADMHHVRAPLFVLARPEQGDEGMLAGVLGIAYRPLPAGGGFSHNVRVSLLDAQGRIVAVTEASGAPDPEFVKAVVGLLERP